MTDADWPTAATWLASGGDGGMVVAGVPLAEGAVTPSAYDRAPAAVRGRLAKLSVFQSELGVDLRDVPVRDLGDSLTPPALDAPLTVLLGGHNGVTYQALAAAGDLPDWGLLTLDAHHDVRPYGPGPPGNGSPVRALIDAGLSGANVVQVGVHGFSNSPVHRAWCEEQGITVVPAGQVGRVPDLLEALGARCAFVYVDVDLDLLDRAHAPGCPGARPGGIGPRALLAAVFAAGAHPRVRALDIVELDPEADVAHVTTDTAALALLNAAAGFATRG